MNPITAITKYNKFIVAVLGAVSVGLTSFEHGQPWVATVLSAISAVLVYLVPNKQPPIAQVSPPKSAAQTFSPGTYGTPTNVEITHTNPPVA